MLIEVALVFVCAWSRPHCDALKRLPIEQADYVEIKGADGALTFLAQPGLTLWNDQSKTPIKVVVSTNLQSEATVGVVLAHEASELLRGWVAKDCGPHEGTDAEEAFALWYNATYGWPVLTLYDDRVWQEALPGQHQVRPC